VKRSKEWWSGLTKQERSLLVMLERAEYQGGRSAYIPDDCYECGGCGTPSLSIGLCPMCRSMLRRLLNKASLVLISRKHPYPRIPHPHDVFPLGIEPIDSDAKIYTKEDLKIKE